MKGVDNNKSVVITNIDPLVFFLLLARVITLDFELSLVVGNVNALQQD